MLRQLPFVSMSLFLLGALLLTGCGEPSADVTGVVKYQDEPVGFGTIAVTSQDGEVRQGMIENGEFRIVGAPVGELNVSVVSHEPPREITPPTLGEPEASPSPAAQPLKHVRVPKKYGDPKTSGLTLTLAAGDNVKDIKLP